MRKKTKKAGALTAPAPTSLIGPTSPIHADPRWRKTAIQRVRVRRICVQRICVQRASFQRIYIGVRPQMARR